MTSLHLALIFIGTMLITTAIIGVMAYFDENGKG